MLEFVLLGVGNTNPTTETSEHLWMVITMSTWQVHYTLTANT